MKHFLKFQILTELKRTFYCSKIHLIVTFMMYQLNYSWSLWICKQMTRWKRRTENLTFATASLMVSFRKWRTLSPVWHHCLEQLTSVSKHFKNEVCEVNASNEIDWWTFEINSLDWMQQFQTNHWWYLECQTSVSHIPLTYIAKFVRFKYMHSWYNVTIFYVSSLITF